MTTMHGSLSLGLTGTLPPDLVAEVAVAAENAGFDAMWVNDIPGGDSIAALGAISRRTTRIGLASGVIPLDRRPPTEILSALDEHAVDRDRLILGIGSGAAATGQLGLVRSAVAQLRAGFHGPIVVGALGPRMRRLGATAADGILLNWLTPAAAKDAADEAHALNPSARVALYVRAALDPAALSRLEAEADRYGAVPSYRANFARLGFEPRAASLPDPGGTAPAQTVRDYRDAVDEVVLRVVVAQDTVEDYLRFVDRAGRLREPPKP